MHNFMSHSAVGPLHHLLYQLPAASHEYVLLWGPCPIAAMAVCAQRTDVQTFRPVVCAALWMGASVAAPNTARANDTTGQHCLVPWVFEVAVGAVHCTKWRWLRLCWLPSELCQDYPPPPLSKSAAHVRMTKASRHECVGGMRMHRREQTWYAPHA